MRKKTWIKQHNIYSISIGHKELVRVMHSEEQSIIITPKKEFAVRRSGLWRPQYVIYQKENLIGTLNYGYFQRKSVMETDVTEKYIFLHRSDLSFRVVNEKSECCMAFHAPNNGNIVIEYNPECRDITLLVGTGLIIYQDILLEYNSTMNLLLTVAS